MEHKDLLVRARRWASRWYWLTEWYAYHPVVKQRLGLKAGERIAGFVYIGTAKDPLEERPRPDMEKIVTVF